MATRERDYRAEESKRYGAAVKILQAVRFLQQGRTLHVATYAERTGLPRQEVKRFVRVIEVAGFPLWEPERGHYRLLRREDLSS